MLNRSDTLVPPWQRHGGGVDNGQVMIGSMSKNAQKFTSPFLFFENQEGSQKSPSCLGIGGDPGDFGGTGGMPGCLRLGQSGFSRFRWTPSAPVSIETNEVYKGVFILAKSRMDYSRVAEFASTVADWCKMEGILNLRQLQQIPLSSMVPLSWTNSPGVQDILHLLQDATVTHQTLIMTLDPQEWKDLAGGTLNLAWRATQVYDCLYNEAEAKQVEVMSTKWRLRRGSLEWRQLWSIRKLALVWRVLWAEKCVLKYQGKTNKVSFLKVAYIFMEELAAIKHRLKEDAQKFCAQQLIPILPVVPAFFAVAVESG
ncbi:hypothetical protein R1sor_000344 [Riccia sorocarpa]|uniref:Uncharacterized protein n=1 Tax=Riccia sorocarpa TaxID=122646 RepID=A0ABD3GSU6_9MARC